MNLAARVGRSLNRHNDTRAGLLVDVEFKPHFKRYPAIFARAGRRCIIPVLKISRNPFGRIDRLMRRI